ncbi:aldehyde dehydrogenase family protein [Agromyces bauzanensis]|uniref:NAD-dependent succinate-semialdehyde dehydrogenase n=1 Tax=Agromyces bauzanensis TaxID=1308924 RepID=A0A917PMR2_9MICO|nr:aldehyde dehydrogenase family protein [Agromyces bauzanensis]GGJ85347.1 NAD-dependent succinate-semialdehyde dehydrogenase [Agromyces bauzanensis]
MTVMQAPGATGKHAGFTFVPGAEPRPELLIDGRWQATGSVIEVRDPATDTVVGVVADGSPADGLAALDAAAASQPAWAAVSDVERSRLFREAEARLLAARDNIARTMVLESGKPLAQANVEIDAAIQYWTWYGGQTGQHRGTYAPSSDGSFTVITNRKPIGPSLLISPWNFPALTPLRKMAAALAAGCTIIVKSAALTPLTSALLVEAVEGAGFPHGVINLIHTSDSSGLSRALMADERLRKVSFTGSTEVGRTLIAQSAHNIISTSMELGGNGPFIVLDDADLDLAVEHAIGSKFRNSGQVCVATNRFIVQRSVADEFGERFVERVKQLRMGHGLDPETDLGPVINRRERDRIIDSVARSRAAGSKLLHGGEAVEGPGSFMHAAVLEAASPDDPLAHEEIFGPVAVTYRVDSAADAIAFANDTSFGLAAFVFTTDVARGLAVAGALESGVVGLNRVGVTEPASPFGGVKSSGLGREGGPESILEFMEEQYIAFASTTSVD